MTEYHANNDNYISVDWEYCEDHKEYINGYEITYNDFYGEFNVWHSEIGFCSEFNTIKEAREYCNKG